MSAQKYCFFLKKHSQIVQFDSQIVQIFLFSSQLVPIGQKKVKKKKNGRHKRDDRNRGVSIKIRIAKEECDSCNRFLCCL